MKKLGVNIDHVATLRQARKITYPSPLEIAQRALKAGADNITFHLREDRRHIQDHDVQRLSTEVKADLNFEMAATSEMVALAVNVKPSLVTLVPEKREELTTEGGLDVAAHKNHIQETCKPLMEHGLPISFFIEPDLKTIDLCKKLGAQAIEIHTGHYAELPASQRVEYLPVIRKAAQHAKKLGLEVHAGHGLNLRNLVGIVNIEAIESFQIGHAIISYALFVGMDQAVKDYKRAIQPSY
jgi:pyridoxine 5-phosphate synthase